MKAEREDGTEPVCGRRTPVRFTLSIPVRGSRLVPAGADAGAVCRSSRPRHLLLMLEFRYVQRQQSGA